MPRDPEKHTPVRTIRIPDWPYLPALAKAREQGTTLSRKVREWMEQYVRGERE